MDELENGTPESPGESEGTTCSITEKVNEEAETAVAESEACENVQSVSEDGSELPYCPPSEYCAAAYETERVVGEESVCGEADNAEPEPEYEYTNAYRHEPSAETVAKKRYPSAYRGDAPLSDELPQSYLFRRANEIQLTREISKRGLKGSAARMSLLLLMYILISQSLGTFASLIAEAFGLSASATAESVLNLILYVLVYPVSFSLVIFTANVGEKHTVGTYFQKPQCSAFYIFKWCVISVGLAYLANVIVNLLSMLFTQVTGIEIQNIGSVETFSSVFDMASQFVILCIFAPFFEELFFRGTLLAHHEKYGGWHTAIVTALMFGLFHQNIHQFVYTFTLGIFLAMVVMRSGSVLPAMIIHTVLNLIAFLQLFFAYFIDNYEALVSGEAQMAEGAGWAVVGYTFFNYLPILLIAVSVIMLIVELSINRKGFYMPCGDSRLSEGEKLGVFFSSPAVIALAVIVVIEMAIFAFVPMG